MPLSVSVIFLIKVILHLEVTKINNCYFWSCDNGYEDWTGLWSIVQIGRNYEV